MDTVRVAVSGFAGLDNCEPGTAVARALRMGWRGGLHIEALGYDAWMAGAWMPGVADHLSLMPPLYEGDEALFDRLMAIHRRRPLDAVIPCLDLEVPAYARLAPRLRAEGIGLLVPEPHSIEQVSKTRLAPFCFENQIPCPRSVHVDDLGDLPYQAEQFGYPMMVKGTVIDAKRAETREQASVHARKMHERWGGGVVLQEVIGGEQFVVAMVAREDGSCLAHVPMRKLGINQRGKGIVGAVVDHPELERLAFSLLTKLDWKGPLELEFMRAASNGRFYLLEVNPRFPSWVLLSHWARCNLPVLLVQAVLGRAGKGRRRPRAGTTFIRDVEEYSVPLEHIDRLRRFRECAPGDRPRSRRHRRGQDTTLRVGVTGVSAFDAVMAGLGVARSLRVVPQVGAVIGLGYGPYDTGLYRSELFDSVHRLPDAPEPGPLLEHLKRIAGTTGMNAVVPCLDFEMKAFASIRDELSALGIRTLLPGAKALDRRRKINIMLGRKRDWGGFLLPDSVRISSESAAARACDRLGLPLVVKGPVFGSQVVHSRGEARSAWRTLREQGISEGVAQAMIHGEDFAVAAVVAPDHRVTDSFVIKKMLRCDRGSTWGAVHSQQPRLVDSVAAFLREIRWEGPVEAEFIRDAVQERFYLIEVNPRFPAWISYASQTGANLPLAAVCLASGLPGPDPSPRSDVAFLRSQAELAVEARDFAAFATRGSLIHA